MVNQLESTSGKEKVRAKDTGKDVQEIGIELSFSIIGICFVF